MARYPGATWDPLGPQTEPRMKAHDIACVHTMVGTLSGTSSMFHQNGYGGTESHWGMGADGRTLQWQDIAFEADANYNGNHRVLSMETADKGSGFPAWSDSNVPAWTPTQVAKLTDWLLWVTSKEAHRDCPATWMCHHSGIPRVLVPDTKPGRRGIAYHRQGVDSYPTLYMAGWRQSGGELWSASRGKVCLPTDTTDVLTLRGWVPLKDVAPDELVASWSMDSGAVSFERCSFVEPFEADVYDVGGFESTANHDWVVRHIDEWCSCGYVGSSRRGLGVHLHHGRNRPETHELQRKARWKKAAAADVSRRVEIPSAVQSELVGLGYSDAEVRLLVWAQGDGHYMRDGRDGEPYGVEWHLAKPRKIARLTEVLEEAGLPFTRGDRSNGTVSLRVYGDEARRLIVDRLPGKDFSNELLAMSRREASVFLDEIIKVDGSAELDCYFSMSAASADVVQAIATLHGRVTSHRLDQSGLHWVRFLKKPRKIGPPELARRTEVACLTTVDGTLIIRQHGRVAITGNCPGDQRIHQLKTVIIPRLQSATAQPLEDTMTPQQMAEIKAHIDEQLGKQASTIVTGKGNELANPGLEGWGWLAEPRTSLLAVAAAVDGVDVDEVGLAAALAPLLVTQTRQLSDADLVAVADAVADEQHRRSAE